MVEFYKPGKIRQKQICFYFFMVIIKMPLKCGSFSKLVNCIRIHIIYNWWLTLYLEEEAEADPLIVSDVSSLLGVHRLVNTRVGHVHSYSLPEGAGDGVGGVDPAERVQYVLQ